MAVKTRIEKYHDWLWGAGEENPSPVARAKKNGKNALRLVTAVVRDISEGDLTLRAASLVYTTLLSFAPLLAISFSVLKGMGVQDQLEPFLQNLLEPLGDRRDEVATYIAGFVGNIQVGVLGAVGVATLIFSVMLLMGQIEAAFNSIWRVASQRSFSVRLRDYLGVLLVGPLFVFLSVAITTGLEHNVLLDRYLPFDVVGTAMANFFSILPYILFMLAFAALYMFMPNTRVKAKPALVAGFVTGLAWKLLGILFAIFVTGSANYAAIYSAFAVLILFMIWLYTGWLIVLAGASMTYYLQNPNDMSDGKGDKVPSYRAQVAMALQAVREIGRAFYELKSPLSLVDLAKRLNAPSGTAEIVAERLVACGVLRHDDTVPARYLPARPFEETSVADLLHLLADDTALMPRLRLESFVMAQVLHMDKAVIDACGHMTLKDLALTGKR